MRTYWKQTSNIKSWCQKVFGLTGPYISWAVCDFMELHGTFPWMFLHYFLQIREEISEEFEQLVKLDNWWNWQILLEYSRYFQDLPKPRYPSHTNSETKKVWNSSSTQAKPSQRSGLRSSTGKVQKCSLTQWLHNQTSCTCAALQQQRSSMEEQQAHSSSREAEEHLSGMCVMQHISITQ